MIGRRIGHCDILQRVGEGGMGQVYAGIDRTLDRPVAIKVLRPEYSRDPAFVARFRAEAAALARLSHPNVASIYSLEQIGPQQFMILELVQGLTLQALLGAHGPLDEIGATALAAQIVAGLAAAHAQGIVHRDLKPANLMVTAGGALKLMDFGIARVRGAERLTRHGHMVGTLAYMAPEQVRGDEGDVRTDIYSAGLVLYEAVAGRPPFSAKSDYEFLDAQVNCQPTPLRDHVSGLTDRFHAAVMRCLEKDPARRFASVHEFGRALGTGELGGSPQELLRARVQAVVLQTANRTPLALGVAKPPIVPPPFVRPAASTLLRPLAELGTPSRRAVTPPKPKTDVSRPLMVLGGTLAAVLGLVAFMLVRQPTVSQLHAVAPVRPPAIQVSAQSEQETSWPLVRLEAPDVEPTDSLSNELDMGQGVAESVPPAQTVPDAIRPGPLRGTGQAPEVPRASKVPVRKIVPKSPSGPPTAASTRSAQAASSGSASEIGSGWLIRD